MAEDSPSLPATPSVGSPPPEGSDWLSDGALLRRYTDRQDEAAFADLVRRHVDLVYAAALRKVGGDAHSAKDVTQRVFTDLARKAAPLAGHPALTGWLFTAAHYAAHQLVRAERRRRAHEHTAHTMNELAQDTAAAIDGERLRPLLDDVVLELNERDREAVLLRFFEGRGFAELGARLQISEDGARSRVERALEKMQGLFARRGITSTSAALALALGSQAAGATAPATLAASITTTALASATGSGTIASWLATLSLMSTTKFTGGAIVLALALAASVAINGYLLLHSSSEPVTPTAALPSSTPIRATVTRVAPLKLEEDATALRDRLRASGMDEATVRGVVEGILRRRYRDKLALVRDEQIKHAWWQDSSWWSNSPRPGPPGFVDNPPLLREMVLDPLDQLFGPDPAEMAEAEARFEFLPPEKRRLLATLDREHDLALSRLPSGSTNSPEAKRIAQERDTKRLEILASFTPEERREHDLRFMPEALGVRERMKDIGATEAEYRAIMAIVSPPGDPIPTRADTRNPAREEQALEKIVATLGYDRALDYIWSGTREYPSYARVAQEAGLPPSTAGRVCQLAGETINRMQQIHADPILSGPEKRAAALALQQQIRPQLDALLPPDLQQRIAGEPMKWFTLLAEGRYVNMSVSATGMPGGTLVIGNSSVETPLPPNAVTRKQFMVRRPASN